MIEKILIPDIGDFQEVEVIEVLVAAGDEVEVEQPLMTLESDKATMDVPSPVAGIIRDVKIKAGDKVGEGSYVADIERTDAGQPAAADTPAPAAEDNTVQEIYVPNIGDFKDVEIIELLVSVGDSVAVEQSLLTLESDKAALDVPSPLAGCIKKLFVSSGDRVSEGTLIAAIVAGQAPAQSAPPAPATPPTAASPAPPPETTATPAGKKSAPLPPVVEKKSAKAYAGPAVRHFARELGVELSAVQGSGRKGRILKEDVTQHVKTALSQSQHSSGLNIQPLPDINFRQFGEVETHPLSRINRLSAAALHRNWLTAPHVTQFAEADITDMENFRQSLAEEAKAGGYRMTPLAFLIKAAVASLREYPKFNSSLLPDGENLAIKKYYHIGVAVETPNGLVVPVIRDANHKGLADIARELAQLSQHAREGKLKKEDMQGGCFTISSLGGIGGSAFTPILNLPEVAILGVSRSQIKPHWNNTDKQFIPRLMLPLALSYDHRVIDGAEGARFITYYSDLLSDIRRLTL